MRLNTNSNSTYAYGHRPSIRYHRHHHPLSIISLFTTKSSPGPFSLVAQFHFCRLGCCSFPIVAPRPQLHLDLLISRRTTFCPEQEEPQNTIRSAKSTLNSSNIAVIAIRNSASTIILCQHRVRARSKSIKALVFNRLGISPRPLNSQLETTSTQLYSYSKPFSP